MKYFSLLVVAGALFLGACKNGNNTPKTSKELLEQAQKTMNTGAGKFSINAPEGWRKTDTTLGGIKLTFLLAPAETDGFRSNINVVTETVGKVSFDEYHNATLATMGKYMSNFQLIGSGEKVIDGQPGKWFKYSADQTGGKDVVALNHTVVKDGIAYIITGVTKVQDEAKITPLIEQSVASFKITQ
ncbi:hypothetical protein [Chitinophaga rhizophila]|uniref:DUF1795 domain-containing protein n=1 Tax=Chitinophaga rhizophila TaxID=2866212 RepID=A0ABS7GK70_9BACT|nr:hypothetical protein [Chitinophaga rhizophila]MBW8687786.1 hypothetical protein [Chitinophaga rhizophila]